MNYCISKTGVFDNENDFYHNLTSSISTSFANYNEAKIEEELN
jgi:hypothetical protein